MAQGSQSIHVSLGSPRLPASPSAGEAAASSQSAPPSPDQAVKDLWGRVEGYRRDAERNRRYVPRAQLKPNHTGVLCPDNAHTLRVRLGSDREALTPIHANYLPSSASKSYAVGQSPEGNFEAACVRDLVQGLDSGQGLFQFTSRNAHSLDSRATSSFQTVAHLLNAALKETQAAGLMLGDRYRVTRFAPLPFEPMQNDVSRYQLTAVDLENNEERTILITQAGLRFVNKQLEAKEIARASELLNAHRQATQELPAINTRDQTGPLICSTAGIGRSATLAVYQDLCDRIGVDVDPSNLDAKLEEAIKLGISARGPKFLHSEKQIGLLRDALLIKMGGRSLPATPRPDSRRQRDLFRSVLAQVVERSAPFGDGMPEVEVITQDQIPPSLDVVSESAHPVGDAQQDEAEPRSPVGGPRGTTDVNAASESVENPNDNQGSDATPRPEGDRGLHPVTPPLLQPTDDVGVDVSGAESTALDQPPPEGQPPDAPAQSGLAALQDQPPSLSSIAGTCENLDSSLPEVVDPAVVPVEDGQHSSSSPDIYSGGHLVVTAESDAEHPASISSLDEPHIVDSAAGSAQSLAANQQTNLPQQPAAQQTTPEPPVSDRAFPLDASPPTRPADGARTGGERAAEDLHATDAQLPTATAQDSRTSTDQPSPIHLPAVDRPENFSSVPLVPGVVDPALVSAEHGQHSSSSHDTQDSRHPNVIGENPRSAVAAQPAAQEFADAREALPSSSSSSSVSVWAVSSSSTSSSPLSLFSSSSSSSRLPTFCAPHERTDHTQKVDTQNPALNTGNRPPVHSRKQAMVKTSPHSTLNARLNGYQPLNKTIEALRKWIYELAPILPKEPNYFEDVPSRNVQQFNFMGYALSRQLNFVVENWRKENYTLLDNVAGRPKSALLNAATVLETPHGSAERYLHANHIQTHGCGIAFIAAQRPQTVLVPRPAANKVVKFIRALPSPLSSQRQARVPVQTVLQADNSTTFWQTVLNENVNVIVDLDDIKTKPTEMPYGPKENFRKDINTHWLKLMGAEQRPPNLHIELIEASVNNQAKNVLRLHYTAWPDGGVIKPQALIDLARDVEDHIGQPGTKVLVHSTRGVGRTGTLITFIAASEQIAALLQEHPRHRMTLKKFIDIVMNLVIQGRLERGRGYVNDTQMPLLVAALSQKHFDRVEGSYGAPDAELVRK